MYAPLPFKSYKCITAALNQFLQVDVIELTSALIVYEVANLDKI